MGLLIDLFENHIWRGVEISGISVAIDSLLAFGNNNRGGGLLVDLLLMSHYHLRGFLRKGIWECLAKGKGSLSIYSIDLNANTNVVGFYATKSKMLPIDHAKNTRKRMPIRSRALVWYRPKTFERENKNPYLNKAENTYE